MRFECQDWIDFRAEDVFDEALASAEALVALLPDVARIEVVSTRPCGIDVWERVDRWTAAAQSGEHASASWIVTSRWDRRRLTATWHIDALQPRDGASSEGVVTFAPRGEHTLVTVAWDLTLMGYSLPLPTRALAIALAPHAEAAVSEMVERNAAAMLGAIEGRLATAAPLQRAS